MTSDKYVTFDPDFLLWILIKFRRKENELIKDFFIDFFTDLSTTGDREDFMGKVISSKESRNVAQSVPMLLTILSGRDPKSGKFAFTIDDYSGTVEIRNLNVIFIAQSIGIFNLVPNEKKIAISIHFLNRILELYYFWLNLDSLLKYPNDDDFIKIIKDCKKLGVRIYNIEEIKKKYDLKRK